MVVVFAIIALISAFVLVRQSRFNSSTLLRSLAYSVALSVRQAQIYGAAVRGFTTGSTVTFASSYGVYFAPTGSNPITRYTLFADYDNDGRHDTTPVDETVQSFDIRNGYSINKFCATKIDGSMDCWNAGVTSVLNRIAILFKRPNPDALFVTNIAGTSYVKACIQLNSPGEDTKTVSISSTGQISVNPQTGAGCL